MGRFAAFGSLFLILALARPAFAHNLLADAKLHGDRVEVEAFYDDNTPARKARVVVTDAAGNQIAEGLTDAEGRWNFPKPAVGKYTVVVDAGAGHRAEVDLTVPAEPPPGEMRPVPTGPSREELTAFPWLRVILGLVVIAGAAVLLLVLRRR